METKDVYWAAAFIEGEGNFHAARNYSGDIQVGANQVQKWPLDKLQQLFGGNFRRRLHSKKNPNWSDQWTWAVTGTRAVGVMMTLYCLMSPRRQEQIKVALDRWKSWGVANKNKGFCSNGHRLDGIDCRERRYCVQCKRRYWREYEIQRRAKARKEKLARGESLPVYRKITSAQIREMQQRVFSGEISQSDAAKEYGISPTRIHFYVHLVGNAPPDARKKLNMEQVREIRKLLEAGIKHKQIAGQFGVKPAAVSGIATGHRWKGIA